MSFYNRCSIGIYAKNNSVIELKNYNTFLSCTTSAIFLDSGSQLYAPSLTFGASGPYGPSGPTSPQGVSGPQTVKCEQNNFGIILRSSSADLIDATFSNNITAVYLTDKSFCGLNGGYIDKLDGHAGVTRYIGVLADNQSTCGMFNVSLSGMATGNSGGWSGEAGNGNSLVSAYESTIIVNNSTYVTDAVQYKNGTVLYDYSGGSVLNIGLDPR